MEIYINIEQAIFQTENSEFHVKVAEMLEETCKLLEVGFEYVADIEWEKTVQKTEIASEYGKPYKSPYRCSIASWRDQKVPKWEYSITEEELDPEKTVKASGREVRVSHKSAREVCKTIKGMTLIQAKQYLKDVIAKKRPVPFTRFKKKAGHRHGLEKAYAGRYPVKVAKHILKVLEGAEANAEYKGLDTERLRIIHASAYPGMKIKRYIPRAFGRTTPKFQTLCHIEVALEEQAETGEEA